MPIGKRRKSSQSECSNREKQSVRMTTDPSDAGVEDKRKDTEYMCGTGDKDHYSQTTASSASGQCNAQGRSEASSSGLDTPTEPSQPRPPVPKNMSTRSSTRVIKRPKRDTQSPPPSPVKKPVKEAACKTSTPETKRKRQWELWGNADKNTFFEGLYEFGKDFDAIQGHIALKCKRKGVAPSLIKNKDQVRHFYYRTWHKISKYIHFPEDVKKQTQELYGLINYGELRKKICGNLDERILQKLNELIHKGNTCLRIKGKTHKIRTPVCNALKKLNNVEEPRVEDIPDVPNKVTLEIGARTNAAWACVQDLAQNPRLRITVKATHRLAAVIAFLEKKWKSQRLRIKESLDAPETAKKELRLFPHKESQIHPVSLSRVEVQTRPEIHFDSYHQNILVKATKRARDTEGEAAGDKSESSQSATEAGSVTSPDLNRRPPTVPVSCGLLMDDENAMFPDDLVLPCRTISSSTTDDDMCTEINYSEVLNGAVRNPVEPVIADFGEKVSTSSENAVDLECMAPALEAPSVTILDPVQAEERIRRGWSSTDCENLSLAELYLMFGEGGKLQLEYEWCDLRASNVLILCQLTNLLRRLVHIATTEFSDFNKQKEESQKSGASGLGAVCEKCSSPMVNSATSKSSGNKTASKATSSPSGRNANNRAASPESKEAVFRVPASVLTQGIPQRIPVVTRPGAKPAEMLMPPHLRAKSRGPVRKPMIVQRRLLPKSQMMTLSMVPTSSMAGTGQFVPMKRVATTSIHNPAVIPRVIAVPSPKVSSTLLPAMDRSGPATVKTEPVTPDLSPGGPLTSLSDPMLAVSAVTTSPALPTASTSPAPSTLNASSASTPTISGDGASVRLLASQIEADLAAVLPSHFPPEDSADPLLSTPLSAKSQGTLVTPSCSPTSPSPTHSTSHAVISPPNIPSLLDLSLSQPPTGSASGDKLLDLGIGNFNSGLTTLLDKSPGEKPTLSLSDSSQSSFKLSDFVADGQWLGSDIQEVADISLGSFLEATEKRSSDSSTLNVPPPPSLFSDTSRDLTRMDVDSTLQCMLNESSMDYAAKFADIAAQMVASSDPVKENPSHFNADIVQ